jgi:tRNA nucleotidyltransferase (CCA-adding enzyme)
MAFNPRRGLVDPTGGRADLSARLIRAVGDAEKRFSEDALRIMRAFRFAASLGFDIEEHTLLATAAKKEGLKNIARERIGVEFIKLLLAPDPYDSLRKMRDLGILDFVTEGYCPDDRVLSLISKMPDDEGARLGFFLSQTDGERAKEILMGLKRSGIVTKSALATLRGCEKNISNEIEARRLIALCGIYAKNAAAASVLLGNSPANAWEWVAKNTAPCTLRELAITGRDLMNAGLEGREVGKALDAALAAVINDPSMNEKERLIAYCTDRKRKTGNATI